MIKKCEECLGEFVTKYRWKRVPKFCSRKCYFDNRKKYFVPWNKGKIGLQIGWNKGKKMSKITKDKLRLANLGKKLSEEHKRKIGAAGIGRKMSDSFKEKLRKRNKKLIRLGLHPWWKGGISSLNNRIRHLDKYKVWRTSVFARDRYTCRLCGKSGCELNADHYPTSFAKIIRVNNIKTLNSAIKCFELWDINNGRTLCKKCHKTTKTYGIKNINSYA